MAFPFNHRKEVINMKKSDRQKLLLHEKNLYKAFAILATPVFFANMLKSFHDLVDTYFIGQMENSVAAQAGISIAWPPLNILMSLVTGLCVAGVAVISQYNGAGDKKRSKQFSMLLLELAAFLGIILNILVYVLSPFILTWMGAKDQPGVYEEALTYLRVRAFEMVPFLLFSAFQAIRQARGDTQTPVTLSFIAVGVNIVLTGVFVKIYGMGVFGAALATVIGQVVILPICLYLLFSRRGDQMTLRDIYYNAVDMAHLFRIAAPSAGTQALASLGFMVLQSIILQYGAVVAAAFSIGNKVSNLLLMPMMALSSVLAAFIGQNVGAGNPARARNSYRVSRNLTLIISIIGAAAIYPFRETLLSLLTNSAETLSVAMEYIFWVLLTQPLMGMFQNYMGVFNGSGNTRYSLTLAVVRLWFIRLPMIYAFRTFTDIGRSGIWYAMVISNFLMVFFGLYLLKKVTFEPIIKEKKIAKEA